MSMERFALFKNKLINKETHVVNPARLIFFSHYSSAWLEVWKYTLLVTVLTFTCPLKRLTGFKWPVKQNCCLFKSDMWPRTPVSVSQPVCVYMALLFESCQSLLRVHFVSLFDFKSGLVVDKVKRIFKEDIFFTSPALYL